MPSLTTMYREFDSIVFASQSDFLISSILMLLTLSLDCVDGELARYTDKKSILGLKMESAHADLTLLIYPSCVSIGLFNSGFISIWMVLLAVISSSVYVNWREILSTSSVDDNPNKFSQAYNFGPRYDEAVTVEQLVKQAISEWGEGRYRIEKNINNFHEAHLLRLDCSKAVNSLKWKPKWNAVSAIQNTIIWYKKVLNNQCSALDITLKQIENYLS